jgi:hypothetical protein
VPGLLLHRDAKADIATIGDPGVEAKIYEFLRAAKSTPGLLDTFTATNFGRDGVDEHNVKPWGDQQRRGRNLWRIKLFALEHRRLCYRIVYAFNARTKTHYVLGVVKHDRDFDYRAEDAFTERVTALYDTLRDNGTL